ncbi:MAG: YaeQ family protein [Rhodocyclaceae bacterium]|nr:YaeQ family protein [Rhodocyclaceae bacterium]MBX3669807.1 YaeQ family protein [Rhodocyclaceae bacterium]
MALKSTICKAALDVADIERGHYAHYDLVLARHPSETEERMMLRLAAFALHAGERLEFGRGVSNDDEAALWQRDHAGNIELWMEVGLPDERRLRRASGRAARVIVYAYGGVEPWWDKQGAALARLPRLSVHAIAAREVEALALLADRSMRLQCTIQEGRLWLSDATRSVEIAPHCLLQGEG